MSPELSVVRVVFTVLGALFFLSHWWMMLFAKQRLGSERTDKSFDPLYSRVTSILGFGSLCLWQIVCVLRLEQVVWGSRPTAVDMWTPRMGVAIAAMILYAGGFGLRLWAIRILGRLFTFEIGIRPEHKILESGPYSVIRHPSYTGFLAMMIGFGVLCCSWSAVLGMTLPTLWFFITRIRAEEKMLAHHFGSAYLEYQKRTKRLVPGLY